MKKKKRQGYAGGLCDPQKAITCTKTHCSHLENGECRHTTRIEWLKVDYKKGVKN